MDSGCSRESLGELPRQSVKDLSGCRFFKSFRVFGEAYSAVHENFKHFVNKITESSTYSCWYRISKEWVEQSFLLTGDIVWKLFIAEWRLPLKFFSKREALFKWIQIDGECGDEWDICSYRENSTLARRMQSFSLSVFKGKIRFAFDGKSFSRVENMKMLRQVSEVLTF